MSYPIEFTFRGLAVSAEIDECSRGSYWEPPSGGGCEHWEFTVEDMDEVLEHLELSEGLDRMLRAAFKFTGIAPQSLIEKLEREWADDIDNAAGEYWNDIGGPGGMKDYNYEG